MWIFSTRGYYSIAEAEDNADNLQVRARTKGDLENLRMFIPRMRILHTPDRDYGWRVIVSKKKWADVVGQLIQDITYPKFKTEVEELQGEERYKLYLSIWSLLTQLGKPWAGLAWDDDDWDYTRPSYDNVPDYTGRSPVPDHWKSAKPKKKKRNKRNKPGHPGRTQNQVVSERQFRLGDADHP